MFTVSNDLSASTFGSPTLSIPISGNPNLAVPSAPTDGGGMIGIGPRLAYPISDPYTPPVVDPGVPDVPDTPTTPPVNSPQTPQQPDDPINITVNSPGLSLPATTSTDVPAAESDLGSILASLGSLFSGVGGTTAPPSAQPATVSVPVTNGTADTASSGSGKSVVIVAGVVLGLTTAVYLAYKKGLFGKKKKGDKPAKANE